MKLWMSVRKSLDVVDGWEKGSCLVEEHFRDAKGVQIGSAEVEGLPLVERQYREPGP